MPGRGCRATGKTVLFKLELELAWRPFERIRSSDSSEVGTDSVLPPKFGPFGPGSGRLKSSDRVGRPFNTFYNKT